MGASSGRACRGYSLKLLVAKRLEELGKIGPGPHANEHLPGPEMLISIYNYGDDIHWGTAAAAGCRVERVVV